MSKLEAWQRYRKASPCPICAGYGAYKPENRCKGFLTADGQGAYCSREGDGISPKWFEALGLNLYYHPLYSVAEIKSLGRETKSRERGSRIYGDVDRRSRLLRMRSAGRNRAQRRRSRTSNQRAERPPHPREFG